MKTLNVFFVILVISAFLFSCKKDSDNNSTSTPTTIFSSKFDNQEDLSLWTQSAGGQAIIDSSAVMFTNITECFYIETLNLIPVHEGRVYELKLIGKVNPAQPGDPAFCAGNFMINVRQGSTILLNESFGHYTSWTKRSFSFEAETSSSINIKFFIGTTRGAWIDNLELVEY
jgi:hypothetical protein